MAERRKPRSYMDELKQQIVQLYHNGKRIQGKDNRSPEKQELIDLNKRLKQLEMENDIL